MLKLMTQHGLNPKAAQVKPNDITDMSYCSSAAYINNRAPKNVRIFTAKNAEYAKFLSAIFYDR